jgi:hypothetical protein
LNCEEAATEGDEAPDAQNNNKIVVQQFPGHSPILSSSPYFAAQASASNTLQHLSPHSSGVLGSPAKVLLH